MFSRAKQGLLVINRQAKNGSDQEKKVAKNVVSSLAHRTTRSVSGFLEKHNHLI